MEDGISGGLQHHPKTCCKKDSHHRRWAYIITLRRCNFQTSGLVYNSYTCCMMLFLLEPSTVFYCIM